VDTLSAYQSSQPGYTSTVRRRRKNSFVASPKYNPEPVQTISSPNRIRAILAILESSDLDDELQSFVSKRDIQDALEFLDEDLKRDEDNLKRELQEVPEIKDEIKVETFFRR